MQNLRAQGMKGENVDGSFEDLDLNRAQVKTPTTSPSSTRSRAGARARMKSSAKAQPAPGRSLEGLFFKTKICAFWQEGRCLRGSGCKYAHGDTERQAEPDLSKTALCNNILRSGVCEDPNCTFAHSRTELRSTDDVYKTAMCTFFRYSRCQMGANCRHAHHESELRPRKDRGLRQPQKEAVGIPQRQGAEDDDDDLGESDDFDLSWERSVTMPSSLGRQRQGLPLQRLEDFRPPSQGQLPVVRRSPDRAEGLSEACRWADMDEDEDLDLEDTMWARMHTMPTDVAASNRGIGCSGMQFTGGKGAPSVSSDYSSMSRQCSTADTLPGFPQDLMCHAGGGCSFPAAQTVQKACVASAQMPNAVSPQSQGMPQMAPIVAATPGLGGTPVLANGYVMVPVPVMMLPQLQALQAAQQQASPGDVDGIQEPGLRHHMMAERRENMTRW